MRGKTVVWSEHMHCLCSVAFALLRRTVEKLVVYTKEKRAPHEMVCSHPISFRRVDTLHVPSVDIPSQGGISVQLSTHVHYWRSFLGCLSRGTHYMILLPPTLQASNHLFDVKGTLFESALGSDRSSILGALIIRAAALAPGIQAEEKYVF